jgi:hypothetical protein
MRAATLALLLAVSAPIATATTPAPAQPQSQDARPSPAAVKSAAVHFRRGVSLYKDGDFGGALVEFRRAYETAPNYHVLYNLGQSQYQLQKYAEALISFEGYLAKGGAQIGATRRGAVEEDLRTLRARVGHVTVTVAEDGAEVLVDDESVGIAPLKDPVLVSVGHRKITVSKPGNPPVDQFVDVAAGDWARVAFDKVTGPSPPAAEPPPAPAPGAGTAAVTPPPSVAPSPETDPTSPHGSGRALWIPWTITGVLAAGTAATGILALTWQSALDKQLGAFPGNQGAINDDRSQAKTFAVASDILLAATVVSFGVSMVLTLAPAPARSARSGPAPRISISPLGAGIVGEY